MTLSYFNGKDRFMEDSLKAPPNANYQKFFDKFKEINNLEKKDYSSTHMIGYFCSKYKEHYNTNYQFKFNTPQPSKCYEVFQIKKLANILSSDPIILTNYIDWVFETRVRMAKRKLTSIAFLTVESLVQEYKMKYLFNPKIDRSTSLNEKYFQYCNPLSIKTYGDLAFIIKAKQSLDEETKNRLLILEQILINDRFDFSILDKIA